MTCQQHEADLVDLARGALAEGDAAVSVRNHLGACEACAARFERERRLTAGFRELSGATAVPANDIAERRLMAAFDAARPPSRQSAWRRVLPALRTGQVAAVSDRRWLTAAACVLFFVGAWAAVEWRTRMAAPQGTAASARTSSLAPAEQPGPVEQAESPAPAPAPLVVESRRARTPRVVPAALRNELPQETDRLAGFIPLPAAGGLPGFDSGMIVRVALPTASLPAYGLAITPESTSTVNADLLVGQDGQARAIRLVSLVGGSRREPQ